MKSSILLPPKLAKKTAIAAVLSDIGNETSPLEARKKKTKPSSKS